MRTIEATSLNETVKTMARERKEERERLAAEAAASRDLAEAQVGGLQSVA